MQFEKSLTLANQLKNWLSPATKMGFNTGSQNFKLLLENFAALSTIAALDTGIYINPSNIKIRKGEMVPVIRQVKKKLVPPILTKGRVTPVTGNKPTFTAIFVMACITNVKLSANARNAPNANGHFRNNRILLNRNTM